MWAASDNDDDDDDDIYLETDCITSYLLSLLGQIHSRSITICMYNK